MKNDVLIKRIILSLVVGFVSVQAYASTYEISSINNFHDYASRPRISEDNVVWQGEDGNDSEIFFFNGTTTTQITDNDHPDGNTTITGTVIDWSGRSNDGNDNVHYLYDGTTTAPLSATTTGTTLLQNGIVWDFDDGNDTELYFFDGLTTTQISNNDNLPIFVPG